MSSWVDHTHCALASPHSLVKRAICSHTTKCITTLKILWKLQRHLLAPSWSPRPSCADDLQMHKSNTWLRNVNLAASQGGWYTPDAVEFRGGVEKTSAAVMSSAVDLRATRDGVLKSHACTGRFPDYFEVRRLRTCKSNKWISTFDSALAQDTGLHGIELIE